MNEVLARGVELKDGTRMDVVHLVPPDETCGAALRDLYAHKPGFWHTYIDRSLEGRYSGLCADHFFFGVPDRQTGGRIPGGMWFVGSPRNKLEVATFGHVFTRPEARGRGIAGRIMERVCAYYREVMGGRAMYLGSDGDLARRMYAKAGFAALQGPIMRWVVSGDDGKAFEEGYFAPGSACAVRDADLGDLAGFEALYNASGLPLIIDHGLRTYRGGGFEGGFLEYFFPERTGTFRVLETDEAHRVVGAALVRQPGNAFLDHVADLEFCVHPSYAERAGDLIASVVGDPPVGAAVLRGYSAGGGDRRGEMLASAGFEQVAEEPDVLKDGIETDRRLPLVTWHLRV